MDFRAIILYIFVMVSIVNGVEIDKELFQKAKYIDVVTTDTNESYICYMNDLGVQGVETKNIEKYTLIPKIDFYNTSKNKTMAIISLAENKKWLDLSIYDKILFDGECKKCTIAIATKDLYEKDDNYYIGKFQNKIDISKLLDIIDLRRSKYIVLFADKNEDIDLKTITFFHTPKQNSKKPLSVWIWATKDINIKLLKKHNIKRVYLQINNEFTENVKTLFSQGFEIFALDGEPSFVNDDMWIKRDLELIEKNKKMIKGFQVDIEPHLLQDFSFNKEKYSKKLLDTIKILRNSLDEKGLKLSIVMPFWYDSIYIDQKNLSNELIKIADEVILMSYRTNLKDIISISAQELNYAQAMNKKIKLGIELTKLPSEIHKIYKIKDNNCENISFDSNCLQLIDSYEEKSNNISFYGQFQKLPTVLNSEIDYGSFDGYVLHHAGMIRE